MSPAQTLRTPARAFIAGASTLLRGLRLGLGRREVRSAYWRMAAAHVLVTLLFEVLGAWGVIVLTRAAEDSSGWATAGLVALRIAGLLVVLVAGPILAVIAVNLALPFLAEKLFLAGLHPLDPARAKALTLARGLPLRTEAIISLRRLLRFVVLTLGAFTLSFLPFVGPLLGPLAQVLVTASFLGWELLDPWLAKEGIRYAGQRRLLGRHRPLLLGFALPCVPLVAVPLIGPACIGLLQSATALLVAEHLHAGEDGAASARAVSSGPAGDA